MTEEAPAVPVSHVPAAAPIRRAYEPRPDMPVAADNGADSRLELIFQQIAALPTLPSVAVRVMAAGDSGDIDLRDIARLIESDPAMTAKVLALCRRADLGVAGRITTVERAVIMLGLDAVRAAVLSVAVHGVFEQAQERQPDRGDRTTGDFDRSELWRHSLAVACAAEMLAQGNAAFLKPFSAQEAFLAGLLHDLGKLALDAVLPQTYARVAELASARQFNVTEVERRVIGIDHHTAGKRLAEHWGLPHALQDVMWLHGQDPQTLPDVPHRSLIAVVSAADALARALHLGWSGNFTPVDDPREVCSRQGLTLERGEWEVRLSEMVSRRAADLGLSEGTTEQTLLRCLVRANARLGRLSGIVDERARAGSRGAAALTHLSTFYARSAGSSGLVGAMEAVGRSALDALGPGPLVLVMQTRDGAAWSLHRIDGEGRPAEHATIAPPASRPRLADFMHDGNESTARASALATLAERASALVSASEFRLLPMSGGSGLSAVLLHDRAEAADTLSDTGLRALGAAWGAALASAAKHEGARRLGENLAEANRRLTEAQNRLVESQSLARLGQMTAGAAHEMNNPLAIISGQCQLAASRATDPELKKSLDTAVAAAERLSDLIESLHLFAEAPEPRRENTSIAALLSSAAEGARTSASLRDPASAATADVRVIVAPELGDAHLDPRQLSQAVTEVILNALQSSPKSGVEVRAQIDPLDDRLIVSVIDDGVGMTPQALLHAADPFFSERQAGRRAGLGLTRARRLVELHGGEVALESTQGKGTNVRISLPGWRVPGTDHRARAA